MNKDTQVRTCVAKARRIVVKVGSSSLASVEAGLNHSRLHFLVDALAAVHKSGREVVLVSSGAIAAGLEPLGLTSRSTDLAKNQAAAAVGQGLLLSEYTQAFAKHGVLVAQVLLTVGDLARKSSYTNALSTFGALTRLRVLPIVNENDTVATREITFGDNDRLAALVAELVHADALVLLSDVDGLYTTHPDKPDARRIDFVAAPDELAVDVTQLGTSGVGRGGMASKIEAARLATNAGIPVVLARWDQAETALGGADVGTAFAATSKRLPRRLGWLADASQAKGRLHVDSGAVKALTTTPASLLAAGIKRIEGNFRAGDPVEIVAGDDAVIGRGLVGFDSAVLPEMLGRTSTDLAASLGAEYAREVVHRDDLVLASRR
ncbi:MAG: glutamate 5-kinase [Propionibacteriaceae bacterium]|nr:glutamate 5-kinase [Propionibacteriaceae bacterium]